MSDCQVVYKGVRFLCHVRTEVLSKRSGLYIFLKEPLTVKLQESDLPRANLSCRRLFYSSDLQ